MTHEHTRGEWMPPSIHAQVRNAFKLEVGNDLQLIFALSSVIEGVRCSELTHEEVIKHCLEKDIPLIVNTMSLGNEMNDCKFILRGRGDGVQLTALEHSRCEEHVFTLPIDELTVDLAYDYRQLAYECSQPC